MTGEFLTKGLENDRYLKAIRLADEFETEIIQVLRRFGDLMVDENPELFDSGEEGDQNIIRQPSRTLGHSRLEYPMNRVQSLEDGSPQKLNIHLYWVSPETYNRTDVDGTLRAFGYKIKNADPAAEERVVAETQDWDLHTANDPWGSRTAFYEHVGSHEDIQQTGDLLVEHFSEFGSAYGVAKP
ncbi:hypothetical protein BRC85_04955 [Halobacteriales archaeon QS_1_69_70]|nr:MAG: hypothetical protein BRC85_04955 [Halobacteriales archaeon QS_1_69_70]